MIKDLIDEFSPKEMCKYCTLCDECEQQQVFASPGGAPIFAPCTDDYTKLFDIDLYLDEQVGIPICTLCRNQKDCEDSLPNCKNLDKLKFPCHGGRFQRDFFEDRVLDALFRYTKRAGGGESFEIISKEEDKSGK